MVANAQPYALAAQSAWSGEINFPSDTIKAMLTTSTYSPNLDTHRYKSSVTNEVVGTGYTAGGVTLASKTVTYTAANSWGVSRANSTAYALGDIVRPATGNGFLYRAVVAGTSGASIPTYPTVVGQTVTDGGVTWVNLGKGLLVLDAADPQWTAATLTARYLIFYKSTGTDATSPLISLVELSGAGTDTVVTSGNLTYVLPATGLLVIPVM
jgi:hypothetical protein